jgi:glutathione peroxidase
LTVRIYDFVATTIDGLPLSLSRFRGEVMLIVNVASRCGFTPQYRDLEALYRTYRGHGFVVLGFPCDQFGRQEPGSNDEIRAFCVESYGVTFPLFAKIEVNGPRAHPLYRFLKSRRRGWLGTGAIKWNFTKFLIGRDGAVLRRFGSAATPQAVEPDLRAALGAGFRTQP